MFICDGCGHTSRPGQESWAWVSRRRPMSYGLLDREGRRIGTSSGWEIVRELRLCENCYKEVIKNDEHGSETDKTDVRQT